MSAIVFGVHGRGTIYQPIEKDFGFNSIDSIDRDVVDFQEGDFSFRFAFERNGEFLGITLEALGGVTHHKAAVSFKLIQSEQVALIEQRFIHDFHKDGAVIGSTKFMSWEDFTNPKRGIVVDDLAIVRVNINIWKDCGFCSGH